MTPAKMATILAADSHIGKSILASNALQARAITRYSIANPLLIARDVKNSRLMTGFSEQAYSKGYALQNLSAKRTHSKQR
jgi:hypothetical protein